MSPCALAAFCCCLVCLLLLLPSLHLLLLLLTRRLILTFAHPTRFCRHAQVLRSRQGPHPTLVSVTARGGRTLMTSHTLCSSLLACRTPLARAHAPCGRRSILCSLAFQPPSALTCPLLELPVRGRELTTFLPPEPWRPWQRRQQLFFFSGDLGSPLGTTNAGPHVDRNYSMGIRQAVYRAARDAGGGDVEVLRQ